MTWATLDEGQNMKYRRLVNKNKNSSYVDWLILLHVYAFVWDGESFRETASFSSGAEMKSHLKLDKVNVWKDKEENPNMHVEVMSGRINKRTPTCMSR